MACFNFKNTRGVANREVRKRLSPSVLTLRVLPSEGSFDCAVRFRFATHPFTADNNDRESCVLLLPRSLNITTKKPGLSQTRHGHQVDPELAVIRNLASLASSIWRAEVVPSDRIIVAVESPLQSEMHQVVKDMRVVEDVEELGPKLDLERRSERHALYEREVRVGVVRAINAFCTSPNVSRKRHSSRRP